MNQNLDFIYINRMVIPMYLGHYTQENYFATSKCGYIYAKQATTFRGRMNLAILHIKLSHKVYYDQKASTEKIQIL